MMPGRSKTYFILLSILCGVAFISTASAQQINNLRYVNPFIGTTKSNVLTKWGNNGGTYPGAVAPSGAVQLSPETRVTGNMGYDYADSVIYYFSCFQHRSGFPVGSAGRFFVMPLDSKADLETGKYARRFSHKNEIARPGYYKVSFEDDKTTVEATATARTGMFRFTFSNGSAQRLFIGDAGEISIISKKILHFSNGNTVINLNDGYIDLKKINGGWFITFNASSNVVEVKISTSTVDFAGAQLNIDKEIGALSFDQVAKKTSGDWQKLIAKVDIADSNESNKTVFYTALYHSLLLPWMIDDADGSYRGIDNKIYKKSGQNQYGGFSPWDTFRSLNPLLTLLYPDKENDVILSMLDVYKQTGHLPTESMTGNHAIPIIVDSYLKGINGFDKKLAYNAMKSNIVDSPFVQNDMSVYIKNGYVPYVSSESVTRTVEYAYDDWALSRYADEVIHDDKQAAILSKRSFSYRNLFDADELLFLPRNGKEYKINPGMSGYKEGDKWVYNYFVPHNPRDLINLLGGNDQFASRLDSALTNNVILFDNETVFHLPYLFNQAGKPWLTQKWCRQIMQGRFSNTPGGLPGNDDLGSTSSWYVFSALGVYPVSPGRPWYAIGAPMFQSVLLHLPNGKTLKIISVNARQENTFVQSLKLNDQPLEQMVISHADLVKGGSLIFVMGNKPVLKLTTKNSLILSETKSAPRFSISGVSASKREVKPDESFFVKFLVTNAGSTGTKTLNLLVNGKQYGHKNVLVGTGQTVIDSVLCKLYPVGKSALTIGHSSPLFINVNNRIKNRSGDFKISSLSASAMVKQHAKQQVKYNIQNVGGFKETFHIPFLVDDSLAVSDTISLDPGTFRIITHNVSTLKTGFHQISVDSAKYNFKVYSENTKSLLLDLPLQDNGSDHVAYDRSGFHYDGCIMPAFADHTKTQRGKLLFGPDCFVEVPNTPGLDEFGETITMMAWVYPLKTSTGLTDIFTKGDTNVLQVTDGKTLTFFAGGWGRGDCTVALPTNWLKEWHHIAGVCLGKTLYVYIDGFLKGTTIMEDEASLSVNNKWTLGRNEEFPSERIYNGYIRDAKVFREALSKDEIISLYKTSRELIINSEK